MGFEILQCLVVEYIRYPPDLNFAEIFTQALKTLQYVSGANDIKYMNALMQQNEILTVLIVCSHKVEKQIKTGGNSETLLGLHKIIVWVICNILKMPNVHSTMDTILEDQDALGHVLSLLRKHNQPLIYECLYLFNIITETCNREALMTLVYA